MTTTAATRKLLAAEVARRRTFAIISHPDAGRTTLTEKVLVYSSTVRHFSSGGGTSTCSGGVPADPHLRTRAVLANVRNRDTGRYKQFRAGLVQLDEEGVVHVLRRPDFGDQELIFAGVGQLQLEVARYRMTHEFGWDIALSPAPWQLARETDDVRAAALRRQRQCPIVEDRHGRTLVLFASSHALQWAKADHPDVECRELGLTRPDEPAWR